MKTIIRNSTSHSLYIFPEDAIVSVGDNSIVTPNLIIGDLNSSNATLVENVTPPDDWTGGKYMYTGGEWVLEDSWASFEDVQWRKTAEVTMRQARLSLIAAGQLDTIETAIASLPAEQKVYAETEWQFATKIERLSPTVELMKSALSWTDAEMDQMFKVASGL